MDSSEAVRRLYSCFASESWAERVAAGRPYANFARLWDACEVEWSRLAPSDWLDAFKAHPRLGEKRGHAPASSERQQRGVHSTAPATMGALTEGHRQYDARCGHLFLRSASARNQPAFLGQLRHRRLI